MRVLSGRRFRQPALAIALALALVISLPGCAKPGPGEQPAGNSGASGFSGSTAELPTAKMLRHFGSVPLRLQACSWPGMDGGPPEPRTLGGAYNDSRPFEELDQAYEERWSVFSLSGAPEPPTELTLALYSPEGAFDSQAQPVVSASLEVADDPDIPDVAILRYKWPTLGCDVSAKPGDWSQSAYLLRLTLKWSEDIWVVYDLPVHFGYSQAQVEAATSVAEAFFEAAWAGDQAAARALLASGEAAVPATLAGRSTSEQAYTFLDATAPWEMLTWQGGGFVSTLRQEPSTKYIEATRTLDDGTIAVTLSFTVTAQAPGSDGVRVGFTECCDLVSGEEGWRIERFVRVGDPYEHLQTASGPADPGWLVEASPPGQEVEVPSGAFRVGPFQSAGGQVAGPSDGQGCYVALETEGMLRYEIWAVDTRTETPVPLVFDSRPLEEGYETANGPLKARVVGFASSGDLLYYLDGGTLRAISPATGERLTLNRIPGGDYNNVQGRFSSDRLAYCALTQVYELGQWDQVSRIELSDGSTTGQVLGLDWYQLVLSGDGRTLAWCAWDVSRHYGAAPAQEGTEAQLVLLDYVTGERVEVTLTGETATAAGAAVPAGIDWVGLGDWTEDGLATVLLAPAEACPKGSSRPVGYSAVNLYDPVGGLVASLDCAALGSDYVGPMAWSPDGTKLAFIAGPLEKGQREGSTWHMSPGSIFRARSVWVWNRSSGELAKAGDLGQAGGLEEDRWGGWWIEWAGDSLLRAGAKGWGGGPSLVRWTEFSVSAQETGVQASHLTEGEKIGAWKNGILVRRTIDGPRTQLTLCTGDSESVLFEAPTDWQSAAWDGSASVLGQATTEAGGWLVVASQTPGYPLDGGTYVYFIPLP